MSGWRTRLRARAVRDGQVPRRGAPAAENVVAWSGLLLQLVVLALGVAAVLAWSTGSIARLTGFGWVGVGLAVANLLLCLRTGAAVLAWPGRRRATAVLCSGMVVCTVAGAWIGATDAIFRRPGLFAAVFLPGYVLIAAFLVLDVPDRRRFPLASTLDAAVLGGSVACVGALVLAPTAARVRDADGWLLLLHLAYPLIALGCAVFVLAGAVAGVRDWSLRTVMLLAGLLLMAGAHTLLVGTTSGELAGVAGGFPVLLEAGLVLLTRAACGPIVPVRRRTLAERSTLPVALASVVPVVLVVVSNDEVLLVPALVTLLAVAARFALALRQARGGAAEALRRSRTDDLTGLASRRAVVDRAGAAEGGPLGLIVADLDGFGLVNNALGHRAGDELLRVLAGRLRAELPERAMVARLGGDEFAVLAPLADAAEARAEADRVRDVLARPVELLGHELTLGAAVGIALADPADGPADGADLLRQAAVAMLEAKEQRSGSRLYRPDEDRFTPELLRAAEELRRGLPGELRVWYQPQVQASSRLLAGLEALVRWEHPRRGIVAPGEFLGLARRSGLMPRVTEFVLGTLLADAGQLDSVGVRVRLAFNVAPAELLDPVLVDRLLAEVDAAAVPEGLLTLEVTEDSFLADPDRARQALETITERGLEVSVDDYGAGFSSLSYLCDLPVHELKMDRSIVRGVGSERRSRIIVASTTQMARGLGLRIVAEGVEDGAAADELERLGVDILQGYHFARPMPLPELQRWLVRHRPRVPVPRPTWQGR